MNQSAYPENLPELAQANPPYIDSALAQGSRQGYSFIYAINGDGFTLNANPVGLLRGRFFYTDESGIVRARTDSQAGPSDETIS